MISMEDWVTIKNLRSKNPGMSLREIGRILGLSHNTVKKALSKESPPEYVRKESISDSLSPFTELIFEMSNIKRYRGSRILYEIRSKGYTGSRSSFYYYLGKIKQTSKKTFQPYETAPGEQGQFDWSPYTVLIGGARAKIYIYQYIYGFSRYKILEVSLSENQGAVFEAFERCLQASGGVCQRVQTDNARVFITIHSKDNWRWNPRYLHFCGHYGFAPSRSMPSHPWSKGKVEKPFAYIEDHFIDGNTFSSFEELCSKLKEFQNRVNNELHSVIKQKPETVFAKERASLMNLPSCRYVGIKEEIRKVSYDCLISYNGNRYSVPWAFAGKQVWIKISQGYYIEIYSQANKKVASHRLSLGKGNVTIKDEHYRGNNTTKGNFQRLSKEFMEKFPDQSLFLEKLYAQKRYNSGYQLRYIMELSKFYCAEDFLSALKKAMEYNVFHFSFISGYLEKNCERTIIIENMRLKENYPNKDIKRDLKEYQFNF